MARSQAKQGCDRRSFLSRGAALSLGVAQAGWLGRLAALAGEGDKPKRSCLLLWMSGGPSQTDTFDLKPGHPNGGPVKPIATKVPGIQISEHLPKVATWMRDLAVVRSMSTKEGDHERATQHLRTGYLPQASIQFPALGSLVAHEHADRAMDLPRYVSILPRGVFAPGRPPAGFLSPEYAPLVVGRSGGMDDPGEESLQVENLNLPRSVRPDQARDRLALMGDLEREFLQSRPGIMAESHRSAYQQAVRLMRPEAAQAFDLTRESDQTRTSYGRTPFGQGCLLARRLIERGVPFVEVTLGGWDTHDDNFAAVQRLCGSLDTAWGSLMAELAERKLLESTLVVWMGEFGRTPVINPRQGRDHYPKAWSVVLGGGGIRGGQVLGRTSPDGLEVAERPVSVPDLMATICIALGLDPNKQNLSNVDRPIRLADPVGKPLRELLV